MSTKQQASAIMLVGTGLAVNAVYQLRHGRDPFPIIFMGSVWLGTVVLITALNADLGIALASVYLLAVILTRGVDTFDFLEGLATGVDPSKDRTKRSRQNKRVTND